MRRKRGIYHVSTTFPSGNSWEPLNAPSAKIARLPPQQATGQARVRINGKDIYLGPFDSPESKERYREVLQEWGCGEKIVVSVRIGILCLRYLEHAKEYYQKNGRQTSEVSAIQVALRFLTGNLRFKNMPVRDFKTASLLEVRDAMVKKQFIRKSINCHVNRIRRMFAWGVERELVKPEQLIVLKTVVGLKQGRSRAVESEPIGPVSMAHVDATKDFLRPVVWGMIQLQLLTGMRPGEVRLMRLADINRSGDVWEYVPSEHKTQHRGKQRRIYIGPDGQKVLQPFLKADQTRYVFESKPGKRYGKDSFIKAVSRSCEETGIPSWSPNRLRHTAATEIRRQFGLEASRTILGHTTSDVTQIYAERDFEAARSVIRKIG